MTRKEAREAAFKLTYQFDMRPDDLDRQLEIYKQENDIVDEDEYIKNVVFGVREKLSEIDNFISSSAKDWTVSRMPKADLAILRNAVYEIIFLEEIPCKVSINEAVELSKVYCEDKSKSFINGVLGDIAAKLKLIGND